MSYFIVFLYMNAVAFIYIYIYIHNNIKIKSIQTASSSWKCVHIWINIQISSLSFAPPMCFPSPPLSLFIDRFQLLDYAFKRNRFYLNDVCFIFQFDFVVFFLLLLLLFPFYHSDDDAFPLYRNGKRQQMKRIILIKAYTYRVCVCMYVLV